MANRGAVEARFAPSLGRFRLNEGKIRARVLLPLHTRAGVRVKMGQNALTPTDSCRGKSPSPAVYGKRGAVGAGFAPRSEGLRERIEQRGQFGQEFELFSARADRIERSGQPCQRPGAMGEEYYSAEISSRLSPVALEIISGLTPRFLRFLASSSFASALPAALPSARPSAFPSARPSAFP